MPEEILWKISFLFNEYIWWVNDLFQVKGDIFYGSIIMFGNILMLYFWDIWFGS